MQLPAGPTATGHPGPLDSQAQVLLVVKIQVIDVLLPEPLPGHLELAVGEEKSFTPIPVRDTRCWSFSQGAGISERLLWVCSSFH